MEIKLFLFQNFPRDHRAKCLRGGGVGGGDKVEQIVVTCLLVKLSAFVSASIIQLLDTFRFLGRLLLRLRSGPIDVLRPSMIQPRVNQTKHKEQNRP